MNPARFQTLLKRAHGEHQAGNIERADALYQQALALDPGHPEALYLLAALQLQTGRPESALGLIDRAIARLGRRPELLVNRSSAALAAGRTAEACIDAGEAAEGLPQSFGAWFNLGLAEAARRNWPASQHALARALTLRPADPRCQLHWQIAVLHGAPERYRPIEAAVLAEAAQLMDPLAELVGTLTRVGQAAEASRLAGTVADALPDQEPIGRQWIRKTERAGLARTAERLADRLIERFPDSADARLFVAAARQRRAATEAACRDYRHLLEIKPDYWQAHSNYLISLQHLPGIGPAELAEAHAEWARRHFPKARAIARSVRRGPIRVGWFSPRLLAGPMESFFVGVLKAFPRNGVEHWLYQTHDIADSSTPRFKAVADHFASVADLDDFALADRAVADSIDIAIDLSGHSPHHRLRAFGRRMAPVQVSWLDYFHPTGIPAIDYFFTDRVLGPEPGGGVGSPGSDPGPAAALDRRRDQAHKYSSACPAPSSNCAACNSMMSNCARIL
ncbi:MAG: tetratricopeptide repeat protein [Xanthomonadaceae bacterium]|nr:tetratricopeptide repeat protein [Xanthomonadaceae bacterium]